MIDNISSSQWVCTGRSVQGAAHVRSEPELPNQDAIEWYPKSGTGVPLILAVSDGHGSAKSFRSDRGSKFAVKTAIEVIQEELPSEDIYSSSFIKTMIDRIERRIPIRITNRWKEKVREDFEKHPFNDKEKETLFNKEGEKGLNSINANSLLVYGATLLVVVITEPFILYLQLGDGDILRVDDKGDATRPLPRNPELIGNETTSLCMAKASEQFESEIEFQNVSKSKPALILLSTDGYSNSYASDKEFSDISRNYLQEIRESGIDSVEQQLEELLKGISSGGSGDDITIGLIFNHPEPENIDSSDSQQIIRQETNENRGDLMEVDNKRRQGKTVRNNQGMNPRFITMISLVLAFASACLSTYLLWKLAEVETSLAKKIDTSNREHQKKVTELEEKITQIQSKPNTPTSDRESTGKQQDKQKK